jgi:alkylhydroperoxidase family enzyme
MSDFTIHTSATAPAGSREAIEGARRRFGLVPNLIGVLAESPVAVNAYLAVADLIGRGSFDAVEQHVILQSINTANDCHYCKAAHSAVARMQDVPADVDANVLAQRKLADPRLEALRTFVTIVVVKRGWAAAADVAAFLGAGFTKAQVLEVVTAVGFKTISNYANHIAATPVDAAFKPSLAKAS